MIGSCTSVAEGGREGEQPAGAEEVAGEGIAYEVRAGQHPRWAHREDREGADRDGFWLVAAPCEPAEAAEERRRVDDVATGEVRLARVGRQRRGSKGRLEHVVGQDGSEGRAEDPGGRAQAEGGPECRARDEYGHRRDGLGSQLAEEAHDLEIETYERSVRCGGCGALVAGEGADVLDQQPQRRHAGEAPRRCERQWLAPAQRYAASGRVASSGAVAPARARAT